MRYRAKWPLQHEFLRTLVVQHQAEQMPPGRIMLVGDSLTELAEVPELCGRRTFNVGIAGSTAGDWVPLLPGLIARAKPSAVVIGLGMNDATHKISTPIAVWEDNFDQLLATIGKRPALVMAVPVIEPAKGLGPAIDLKRRKAINDSARRLAIRHGFRFSESPLSVRGETFDGIHYDLPGAIKFGRRMQALCPA